MPHDLVAFSSTAAKNGLSTVAPITDTTQEVQNTNDLVIGDKPNVCAVYGVGSGLARARITSQSLRAKNRIPEIRPVDAAAEPSSRPPFLPVYLPLRAGDRLNVEADNGNVAGRDTVLVWLGDGPLQPVDVGMSIPVRATGTTTLAAGAWTAVTPTLADELEPGTYELLHVRAESAGALAWRVVSKNQAEAAHRPGGIAFDAAGDIEPVQPGYYGKLCTFTHDRLPSIEMLSVSADTAQTFQFWIRKSG